MKPPIHLKCFLFSIVILLIPPALLAQTSANAVASPQSTVALAPGPKPADIPPEWKKIVGVYENITILERSQKLHWHSEIAPEEQIVPNPVRPDAFLVGGQTEFTFETDETGAVNAILIPSRQSHLARTDPGSDPSRFFRITPVKPIAELRAAALSAKPPIETQPFTRSDLVELITLDAAIHLDIRYAQSRNFLSTPVYTQARAFLQRPAAEALVRALHKLRPFGYGLLIHDAYRPWYVTRIFWDATPPDKHIFVANPEKGSKHNRGCAADLTLYDLATGKPVEMPGLYDEMSPRSFPHFPGGTSLERWQRDLLRLAMESEGFTVDENEWWHFDYKDWKSYRIMNVAFEDLGNPALSEPAKLH